MRHIFALPADKVPRDEEFHFKERAKTLVDKWHDILSVGKTPTAANGSKETASPAAAEPPKPAETNGAPVEKAQSVTDVAMTNGTKEEEPAKTDAPAVSEETETKDAPAAMDVDADAKGEADADAPADADAAGDESVLADVTMSEAA